LTLTAIPRHFETKAFRNQRHQSSEGTILYLEFCM